MTLSLSVFNSVRKSGDVESEAFASFEPVAAGDGPEGAFGGCDTKSGSLFVMGAVTVGPPNGENDRGLLAVDGGAKLPPNEGAGNAVDDDAVVAAAAGVGAGFEPNPVKPPKIELP